MNLECNMILHSAVQEFDEVTQLAMAIEEGAELTQALSKRLRGEDNRDNIAKEMADVYIMLRKLEIIFNNGSLVDDYINKKISRLSERIQNHKDNTNSPRSVGAINT